MNDDIGSHIKRGAFWTYSSTFFGGVIQFIGGVLLARILGPADFGVFIAVTAFTAVLSQLVNFGLPLALIQRRDITNKHFNAAFWTMCMLATLCFVILLPGSLWLQQYYHDDRFPLLLLLMSVTFFFIPYVAVSNARFQTEMDFRTMSVVGIKTVFYVLPIGVGLALAGFGPYALAISGIFAQLVTTFMYWRRSHWLPGGLSIKPVFTIIPYALKANLNNMQIVFTERVDNMLVGALIGTAPLGIYNRAYSLSRLPVEKLGDNLQPVLFSGLATIQRDLQRTHQIYHKSLTALSVSIFPFLVLFWLIAPDFIGLLYGNAWMPAVEPLRIMTIGAAAALLTLSFSSVSAAQNLIGKEAWVRFVGILLLIMLVLIFARWGVSGVAIGVSIKEVLVFMILQRVISKYLPNFHGIHLIRALLPAILSSITSFIVSISLYGYFPEMSWVRLFSMILIFLSMYVLTLVILGRVWKTHEEFQSTLNIMTGILTKVIEIRRPRNAA